MPPLQTDPDAYYLRVCRLYEHDVSDYCMAQGKPPLGKEYRGRAATTDTKVVRTPKAPVPKGRQGEVSPAYFQPAVVYAQRFRQLRRLQALVQNLQKASSTITALEYRSGLWASILASTGFPPSFAIWWPTRPVKLVGDIQTIPLEIPTLAHAKSIFAALEADIRHYENQRQSASRARGKAARKPDPALIFQDLRDPMPMSVETLLETTEAQVVEVDPQDFSITVDPPGKWSQALPLLTPSGPTNLIHAESDKLWCDAAPAVQEGDRVRQENYMGSLLDIFRAFGEAWARRWQRHEGVSSERWDQILHTIRPVPDGEKMQLTLHAWRDTVRSKNPRTSPGPDGVNRLDLLAMPDDLTQFVIDICHHAEQTGSWPRAALQGVVSAIQKAHTSSSVNDFRPITIFSLIYRVWGSLRARQCLGYLHKIAPPLLFGNRPGVSASTVWYELQCVIESSSLDERPVCGFTADITKAFNCIPRTPTLAVALLKGLHRSVVVGWTGALTAITRRFKVRSSVGPPLLASTGMPEGCAMSCIGMLLVNIALHEFFSVVAPHPCLTTYVDNWACRTRSPSDAQVAYQHMHAFAEAWDLQLDPKKLLFWATSSQCRRHLRQAGLNVALDFKELGAHVRFSRRKTNYTQTVRIRSLETRWGRLSASLSPYARKVSALKTAAWPRALHSISNVELGECHFSALRSGAMRGINAKAPGANPAYFALQESFLDARRMAIKVHATHTLDSLALGLQVPIPGPIAILLDRANAIGLPWHPGSQTFMDAFGPLDLWECCPNELTFRLTWAWQQSVATKLQHRRGFRGLDLVGPALSRRALKTLTSTEKSMVNVARNGTFFTQDALHYFQEGETPHCVHCGALDSIRHRVFECPFFAPARQQLPVPASDLMQLEDFQSLHAWAKRTPLLVPFMKRLMEPSCPYMSLPSGHGTMDLFTDGTCAAPTRPELRVAAWAVVQGQVGLPPQVVAAGPLQGLRQTAFRAEISAILQACRVVRLTGRHARVWCDCQGVLLRFRHLQQGVWEPRHNAKNYDLWLEVAREISFVGHMIQLCKVAAHDDEAADDPATAWILRHNQHADSAAKEANSNRGPSFWEQWGRLRDAVDAELRRAESLARLHCRVATMAVRSDNRPRVDERTFNTFAASPEQVLFLPDESPAYVELSQRFTTEYVQAVRAWVQRAFASEASRRAAPRWVSMLQLYMDFTASVGFEPVRCICRNNWRLVWSRRSTCRLGCGGSIKACVESLVKQEVFWRHGRLALRALRFQFGALVLPYGWHSNV